MKTAFMFPGQGAQYPRMGKDIYEKYEEAREIYDKASEILNIDINSSLSISVSDIAHK